MGTAKSDARLESAPSRRVILLWSAKAGSGTSVTAVGLALAAVRTRTPPAALLVDLAGDLPAILGLDEPALGIAEWIAQPNAFDVDDIVIKCSPHIVLAPRGSGPLPEARSGSWTRLTSLVLDYIARGFSVVVDVGVGPAPKALKEIATANLTVTRPCYLALRRFARLGEPCDAAILVGEPDRILTPHDVTSVLGVPIAARVNLDGDVARRVDAGVLISRPSESFVSSLAPALDVRAQR